MKKLYAYALILSLAAPMPAAALPPQTFASGELQINSDALGPLILGKNVELMLRDGTYLKGKVLGAGPEEISFHVQKCEPKGRVSSSDATLRTSDIAVVHTRKSGTIAAPVALGVIGGILGAMAGAYGGWATDNASMGILMMAAGGAGGATGGSLLGREAVKKTVTINVVRKSNQSGIVIASGSIN